MAMAVTMAGDAEIVMSQWQSAIAASVGGCDRDGHGPPIAAQLGARYVAPRQVTRTVGGWSVVETWTVWPDCAATVTTLCDVVVIAPASALARWPEEVPTGARYLSLDQIFAIRPCSRDINGEFPILHLAGFDGDTMRRLVTSATDEPPPVFSPRGIN